MHLHKGKSKLLIYEKYSPYLFALGWQNKIMLLERGGGGAGGGVGFFCFSPCSQCVPIKFLNTFLIVPHFCPILFDQSSTLVYIN